MSVRLLVSFSIAVCFVFHAERPRAQQQPPPSPSPQQQQKPDPAASPGEKKPAPSKIANPYASTYQPLPSQTTVIRNATILTAAGPIIERGSLLLQNGKIAAVGQDVNAPAGAVVIDATGKWVTPGIIDTHSHLGVYSAPGIESLQDGNEMTNPVTAEVWADHSIWPQDPQFELALAGGVTAMQILPGSGNLIGGRGVTVKNVPSRTAEGMKFPGAPAGLKMACGENPRRVYGQRNQTPSTRMGNIAVFRRTWQAAADYRDKWKKWRDEGSDAAKRPDRNLQMETLAGCARRRDPRPQPLLSRRRDGDDDPAVEGVRLQDLVVPSRRRGLQGPRSAGAEQHLREHVGRLVGVQARGVRRHQGEHRARPRGEGLRDRPLG